MRALILSILILSSPLSALLAPFYQSVKEIDSILESEELESRLGANQPINSIERTKSGYLITTPTKQLEVDLIYEVSDYPGPKQFTLFFR